MELNSQQPPRYCRKELRKDDGQAEAKMAEGQFSEAAKVRTDITITVKISTAVQRFRMQMSSEHHVWPNGLGRGLEKL